MTGVWAIVMAAGEGVRMRSSLPKVLHEVCGRPMVSWALDTVSGAGAQETALIVASVDQRVAEVVGDGATLIVQDRSKHTGTGGAVASAMPWLKGKDGAVFVLAGDQPLVKPESYMRLLSLVQAGAAAALQTTHMPDPTGYGRIARAQNGSFVGIIEQADCTPEQALSTEVNTSIYCFDVASLLWALPQLQPHPPKGETYLTDVLGLLVQGGRRIETAPGPCEEGMGVNDKAQLAQASAAMRARINRQHMLNGVTMMDPASTYIDDGVAIGRDAVIYPGCVIERGSSIGEGVTMLPGCHVRQAAVGDGTTMGPYAYLRPGTVIGAGCRIGDFVEIKNSVIGDGAKVPHLAYVGDADIGGGTNFGCAAVTVNFDGSKKYRTKVGERAFIGSNVNLVAPVTIGDEAYIAAGSTVTEDVEPGALCIARCRQTVKPGWVAKRRSMRDERQGERH